MLETRPKIREESLSVKYVGYEKVGKHKPSLTPIVGKPNPKFLKKQRKSIKLSQKRKRISHFESVSTRNLNKKELNSSLE